LGKVSGEGAQDQGVLGKESRISKKGAGRTRKEKGAKAFLVSGRDRAEIFTLEARTVVSRTRKGLRAGDFLQGGGFGHLLKIRLKNILVKTKHKAITMDAHGRMVVQAGHAVVLAPTVHTLVFVQRHIFSPFHISYNAITMPLCEIKYLTVFSHNFSKDSQIGRNLAPEG